MNAGHVRSRAFVPRLVAVGDDFETRLFSAFCPKAIALLGRLHATVEDRSIIIQMHRKAPGEAVEPIRFDLLDERYAPLRRRAWRWARAHLEELPAAETGLRSGLHA